jgi:hypothetical protein
LKCQRQIEAGVIKRANSKPQVPTFLAPFRLALLLVAFASALSHAAQPRYARVYEVSRDERVFAYARATGDGRYLAYTSERDPERQAGLPSRTVTVIDLLTRETVFSEAGFDAYWSNDASRMIYLSDVGGVSIRRRVTGEVLRHVAPRELGDYFSWAVRDGKDLIVTIFGTFYYLENDRAAPTIGRVPSCPDIGVGDRPLVSHDGKHITAFVRGAIVVRNLTDCDSVIHTGIRGGKADFSWDGRYVAAHVLKPSGSEYEIQVIDLEERTVRTITDLSGSSLFPSWLRDGRILFNYDAEDYRGFVIASDFMDLPARSLPVNTDKQALLPVRWGDVFPLSVLPERLTVAVIWSGWSSHSAEALMSLQDARDLFRSQNVRLGVITAVEPGTRLADARRLLRRNQIDLPTVHLDSERFLKTDGPNQIPATLLFRDGTMVDSRMGAQTSGALVRWVSAHR